MKLRKQNDRIHSENNNNGNPVKLIEIEERIGLSETIPSCNDCAVTMNTKQITRTRKDVGRTCSAFRKEIRTLFLRIRESGRVSGDNFNIILKKF